MSAMCNLAIVGVSLVNSILGASSLVLGLGLRRRILNARLVMSGVCNLAIVGVSLVKSMLDASALMMGARRRILITKEQRSSDLPHSRAADESPTLKSLKDIVGAGSDEDEQLCQSDDEGQGSLRLNYGGATDRRFDYNETPSRVLPLTADVQVAAEIEDRFWTASGAAKIDDSGGEDPATVVVDVKEKRFSTRW
ncbi:membrane-associated protein, putative [Bodo saltans]|uniref:Membrane-associated protein, putative n=1 Tax=Bodo saltans TaxID=75058 RepID=A0A0S4J5R7_BODSA|nr:membrane-associated protein, putative [Bodo saltans]|eukprot:CUG33659.1 membrane-associated protein, putative [Bodo saltans]